MRFCLASRSPPIAPAETPAKSISENSDDVLIDIDISSARFPPVEDHFPCFSGDHGIESRLKMVVRETMRDDWCDVYARLQHHRHLVPGFIHLASVYAFYGQHIEDDRPPIHRLLV